MKIYRTVSGIEYSFELTNAELAQAFSEHQYRLDKQDITEYGEYMTDDEIVETYGVTRQEFDELTGEIASAMRTYVAKYDMDDMDWRYARDDAIRDVIAKFRHA